MSDRSSGQNQLCGQQNPHKPIDGIIWSALVDQVVKHRQACPHDIEGHRDQCGYREVVLTIRQPSKIVITSTKVGD